MSLPEISHRCPTCGASIRERAMFCPECGNPLNNTSQKKGPAPVTAAAGGAVEPGTKPVEATQRTENNRPAHVARGETPTEGSTDPGLSQTAKDRTRETLQKASSVARGAIGDTGKRVEKIHNVSSAMIEGATYDPSLRFVLVALVLFLIFVVLLVLSKVMG